MTVSYTNRLTILVMQENSKRTLTQLQDGNRIGSCASTQINVTSLVSLRNKNISNLYINFMISVLKKNDSTQYLGVILQSNLKWDKHINNITSKANQTHNFLRRNFKVNSQKIKDHAYKALVRPKLEYSSCIWDPSHTNQIKQIEKVQRRAARFTCNRYHNTSSVTDMLEDLDWPTLQVRRLRTRLIMFYKIIHFPVAIYPSDFLFHSDTRKRPSNPDCYKHIQTSKDAYKYSFYPRTIIQWNQLPSSVVTARRVEIFFTSPCNVLLILFRHEYPSFFIQTSL